MEIVLNEHPKNTTKERKTAQLYFKLVKQMHQLPTYEEV